MATVEVNDDEIVDAIIAKPELIAHAVERLKANVDSLSYHHQRALTMAATIVQRPSPKASQASGSGDGR